MIFLIPRQRVAHLAFSCLTALGFAEPPPPPAGVSTSAANVATVEDPAVRAALPEFQYIPAAAPGELTAKGEDGMARLLGRFNYLP